MIFVINASAALQDIHEGKEPECLSRLITLLEEANRLENQTSFVVALHDRYPESAIQLRSRLSKVLDSHSVRVCTLPSGMGLKEQDEWFTSYLYSFGFVVIDIKSAYISSDLLSFEALPDALKRTSSKGDGYKRLAFVSPIPPQKTGIANYSSELLDSLSKHYDIDLIVEDAIANKSSKYRSFPLKGASWFLNNSLDYDLVVYQVGNSKFHQYQMGLIRRVPGTLVLHDFYLGDLQYYRFGQHDHLPLFERAAYASDGYKGILKTRQENPSEVIRECALNYELIRHAPNIIVHSTYAKNLLIEKYSKLNPDSISVIPHLRQSNLSFSKEEARKALGVADNVFLVCSFGVVGENKLHSEIVDAWNKSFLASNENARMTFVGQYDNPYGATLNKKIRSLSNKYQFHITGWTDDATFEMYLAACDMAIQLRKNSRGETSGTVLDCMKYSVPLIINGNGTMAELPEGSAYRLNDHFNKVDLVHALNNLHENSKQRDQFAQHGRNNIMENHSPDVCAQKYSDALLTVEAAHISSALENTRRAVFDYPAHKNQIIHAASRSYGGNTLRKTLYVDVTATSKTDLRTGIERTTRSLVKELILSDKINLRIEPVYLDVVNGHWTYRHARSFTYEVLGIEGPCLDDAPFEPSSGDLLIGLDHSGINVAQATNDGLYERLKVQGVSLSFLVHDILPVTNPEVFPPEANVHFEDWLTCLVEFSDQIIGVTDHVSREVSKFMERKGYEKGDLPRFDYSHHGADFSQSSGSQNTPRSASNDGGDHFLMVGTLEPRKRYDLALDVFEELWAKGDDSVLLIVGREGWTGLPNDKRRNIPDLIRRIKGHPELGRHLFWFSNASDERLEQLYRSSDVLLAMSEDEGFGLPLIEAAQKGLPIIARDIPVFREVAGDSAHFVEGHYPIGQKDTYVAKKMAASIVSWSLLYRDRKHPKTDGMTWKTWRESAEHLADILLEKDS